MDKYRFEYVKQQINGYEYILKYVNLKRTGSVYKGLCPFHGEKTASFTVYPKGYIGEKGKVQQHASFYCFGCGAAGDVINFKRLKENLDTNEEACIELEKEYGLDVDNVDVKLEYVKQQVILMKNSPGNFLKLDEVNLSCSSQCRNYINIVKEYYPNELNNEIDYIESYYEQLDNELMERSEMTAMELINTTTDMIGERLKILREANKK